MEVNDFARQILFCGSVEQKLAWPQTVFTDHRLAPPDANIDLPARASHLSFCRDMRRSRFPWKHDYANAEIAGTVLHFFANHELLAIELMALSLLRFQDAPTPMRLATCGVIADEIRHFSDYGTRMADFGLSFGDLPLNGFFWQRISRAESAAQFSALMGLTLEQANLDYARTYAQKFTKVGDMRTADLIWRVYNDEISHVAHGAKWFRKLSGCSVDTEWDSYCNAISPSLTPRHARGLEFDTEGRKRARLTSQFITHIQQWQRSRLNEYRVWAFNGDCETVAANPDHQEPRQTMLRTLRDQELLMTWLADPGDKVLVSQQPSTDFIKQFPATSLVQYEVCHTWREYQTKTNEELTLWGHDRKKLSDKFFLRDWLSKEWSRNIRKQFYKPQNSISLPQGESTLIDSHEHQGVLCLSVSSLIEELSSLRQGGFESALIKAAFGASGRNQLRVTLDKELDEKQLAWAKRILKLQDAPLLVEPYFNRVADFGFQAVVAKDGTLRLLGATCNLIDRKRQFQGQVVGDLFASLDHSTKRLLQAKQDQGSTLSAQLSHAVKFVGTQLQQQGYVGPYSVDSFLHKKDGQLYLRQISEVNVRFTMGHVAQLWRKRFAINSPFIWQMVHSNEPQELVRMWREWQQFYPPQWHGEQFRSGVVALSDPNTALRSCAFAFVGRDALREILRLRQAKA